MLYISHFQDADKYLYTGFQQRLENIKRKIDNSLKFCDKLWYFIHFALNILHLHLCLVIVSGMERRNRRSAVELLEESKSLYVKTESVLDNKQVLRPGETARNRSVGTPFVYAFCVSFLCTLFVCNFCVCFLCTLFFCTLFVYAFCVRFSCTLTSG